MKEIVNGVNLTEFDRAHLSEFGAFTLNFEVVYYIKTANYAKYMDIKQDINFGIIEAFEKETGLDVRVSGMPFIRTMNAQNIIDEIGLFVGLALFITSADVSQIVYCSEWI